MLCNQRFPTSWSTGRPLPAARLLIGLSVVVLLGTPASARTIQESTHSFCLEGQRIAMQCFAPAKDGQHPVAALADFFGGLPRKQHANAKDLPPVLIVHGDKDKTVPVEEALELEKLLRQHKRTYEKKIYPKQNHLFEGNYLDANARDAWERTLKFFAKYLQPLRAVRAP